MTLHTLSLSELITEDDEQPRRGICATVGCGTDASTGTGYCKKCELRLKRHGDTYPPTPVGRIRRLLDAAHDSEEAESDADWVYAVRKLARAAQLVREDDVGEYLRTAGRGHR